MSSTQYPRRTQSPGAANIFTLCTLRNLAPNNTTRYGEAALSSHVLVFAVRADLLALYKTARALNRNGLPEEARKVFGKLLNRCERVLGGKHPFTLMVTNSLGHFYATQGNYGKAIRLYEQTLSGREEILGKGHMATLNTVHAIALVYYLQGKFGASLDHFRRLLSGLEVIYGPEDEVVLEIVGMIGVIYSRGQYANAIEYNERAMERMERVLGKTHMLTLLTMENLALVYLMQGKDEKARVFLDHVKAGMQKGYMKRVQEFGGRLWSKTTWLHIPFLCVVVGLLIGMFLYRNHGAKIETG